MPADWNDPDRHSASARLIENLEQQISSKDTTRTNINIVGILVVILSVSFFLYPNRHDPSEASARDFFLSGFPFMGALFGLWYARGMKAHIAYLRLQLDAERAAARHRRLIKLPPPTDVATDIAREEARRGLADRRPPHITHPTYISAVMDAFEGEALRGRMPIDADWRSRAEREARRILLEAAEREAGQRTQA